MRIGLRKEGGNEKLHGMKTIVSTLAVAIACATSAFGADDASPFVCTGQVGFVCGGVPQRFVLLVATHDGRYSFSHSYWIEEPGAHSFRSGDIVHIAGKVVPPTGKIRDEKPGENAYVATNVQTIAHGSFPAPAPSDVGEINTGRITGKYVCVSGVVSSVVHDEMNAQWNWFVLRTRKGNVYVAASNLEQPYAKLLAATDAEVEVRGLLHKQNNWRRFIGPYLIASGEECVRVVGAPPSADELHELSRKDFAADFRAIQLGKVDFTHRVKVNGMLVASGRDMCFLETADGTLLKVIPLGGLHVPEPGTQVSASGFASLDFGGLRLGDAVFEPSGEAPQRKSDSENATMADLYRMARNPDNNNNTESLRRIVTIEGMVANSTESVRAGKAIRIEQAGLNMSVDASSVPESRLDDVRKGCTLRVTGVCHAEFETDPSATSFPRFTGFTIFPTYDDGIVVIGQPPWWTTGKLVAVIVSLLGLLIVFFSLTLVLKKLSDRRGQQLYEEKVAHIRTEAKVEERTRLAIELHDAISQTLTGVALQIDSADLLNNGANKPLGKFLDTARWMLGSCRRELQDCLWDLRSRTFDEKDMTEAVNRAIAPNTGGAKMTVRFNVPRRLLSESAAHSILRMVRELVVNAVRHGGATRIWIAGECSDGHIAFSVRDNGCGFDMAAAPGPRDGHFGLQGIRERVRAAKGRIEIESAPGKGSKITVTMPEGE